MKTAIGLMSGTSLDGVDAALLRTDGERVERTGQFISIPYSKAFQKELHLFLGKQEASEKCIQTLTDYHCQAVEKLLAQAAIKPDDVDVIGFHGQTLFHNPTEGITVQVGDAQYLADNTGIDVVHNFRKNDVAQGGQGAPLVPVYHHALAQKLELPVCFVNIGGVANVTYVSGDVDELLAFDTGPGNALMNDVMLARTDELYDEQGRLAGQGKVHSGVVAEVLARPYFAQRPPKSMDRHVHMPVEVSELSLEDALATLAEITAHSIVAAQDYFPKAPKLWVVCGGGRKNLHLMQRLSALLHKGQVVDIDTLQLNGDAIEAEAFAMLAVRCLRGLPLSYPGTTGVTSAATGGDVYRAAA